MLLPFSFSLTTPQCHHYCLLSLIEPTSLQVFGTLFTYPSVRLLFFVFFPFVESNRQEIASANKTGRSRFTRTRVEMKLLNYTRWEPLLHSTNNVKSSQVIVQVALHYCKTGDRNWGRSFIFSHQSTLSRHGPSMVQSWTIQTETVRFTRTRVEMNLLVQIIIYA